MIVQLQTSRRFVWSSSLIASPALISVYHKKWHLQYTSKYSAGAAGGFQAASIQHFAGIGVASCCLNNTQKYYLFTLHICTSNLIKDWLIRFYFFHRQRRFIILYLQARYKIYHSESIAKSITPIIESTHQSIPSHILCSLPLKIHFETSETGKETEDMEQENRGEYQ